FRREPADADPFAKPAATGQPPAAAPARNPFEDDESDQAAPPEEADDAGDAQDAGDAEDAGDADAMSDEEDAADADDADDAADEGPGRGGGHNSPQTRPTRVDHDAAPS